MSSPLLRVAAVIRPGSAIIQQHQPSLARRTIASSPQNRHKETHNPESDIDKHKQDLLTKHKLGKGHWKPELASNSEEAVKADRLAADPNSQGGKSAEEHMKHLQERTKKAAEETSKAGTSMRDGL